MDEQHGMMYRNHEYPHNVICYYVSGKFSECITFLCCNIASDITFLTFVIHAKVDLHHPDDLPYRSSERDELSCVWDVPVSCHRFFCWVRY